MRLLLDMNISPRWVDFFQINGIEATHWQDCGSPNALDREIMAYAHANGFIVFSHDLDFSALLAYGKNRLPSVIQLRMHDISPETSGAVILKVLQQTQAELEAGSLVIIEPKRSRIRLLPL